MSQVVLIYCRMLRLYESVPGRRLYEDYSPKSLGECSQAVQDKMQQRLTVRTFGVCRKFFDYLYINYE